MPLRLRLRRVGKKKMPMYHMVAADSRAARSGKFLEVVGRYEPLQHPEVISAKEDRVFHWLRKGAVPSDTVRALLSRTGLWMKWSLTKRGKEPAQIAALMERWQMAQAEKRQREEARKTRRAAARRTAKKASEGGTAPSSGPPTEAPAQS